MQIEPNKISIPVFTRNIAESLEFYRSIGFVSAAENELRLGNSKFYVQVYPEFSIDSEKLIGKQSANVYIVAIKVADIHEVRQRIVASSITIEEERSMPFGEQLYIRDPDGNKLMFYSSYV